MGTRRHHAYVLSICAITTACAQSAGGSQDCDVSTSGESGVYYIPEVGNRYANFEVQIRSEIDEAYLRSFFTWPISHPAYSLNFNIDIDDVGNPPEADAVTYDIDSRIYAARLLLMLGNTLEIRANPDHPDYSPLLAIGPQPVEGQLFGLTHRRNLWLGTADGPANDQFSLHEGGKVKLVIVCRQAYQEPLDATWCRMQFPVELGGTPVPADAEHLPIVEVSFPRVELENWELIHDRLSQFVQQHATLVPFEERVRVCEEADRWGKPVLRQDQDSWNLTGKIACTFSSTAC